MNNHELSAKKERNAQARRHELKSEGGGGRHTIVIRGKEILTIKNKQKSGSATAPLDPLPPPSLAPCLKQNHF